MTTATTHRIIAVGKSLASEQGALDGHFFSCSCGERQTTSLSASEATRLANAHLNYWKAVK